MICNSMGKRNDALKSLRGKFYQSIRSGQSAIEWSQEKEPQNHLDFSYNGFQGHVNWYYRDAEIQKYGGNVCVTFRTKLTPMPTGFSVHPYHQDWIFASEVFLDVKGAVEWILDKIQSVN